MERLEHVSSGKPAKVDPIEKLDHKEQEVRAGTDRCTEVAELYHCLALDVRVHPICRHGATAAGSK